MPDTTRTERPARKGPLRMTVTALIISSLFPVVAALDQQALPRSLWVGVADVAFALLLVVLLLGYGWEGRKLVRSSHRARAYQWISGASILLLVIVVAGIFTPVAIEWDVLVVGWAWRAWLTIAQLPALISIAMPDLT